MSRPVSSSRVIRPLVVALTFVILVLCAFLLRPILLRAGAAAERDTPPALALPQGEPTVAEPARLAGITADWWAAVQEHLRHDDYLVEAYGHRSSS